MRVSPTQLSVLRMIPVAHRVAQAGRGRLAVYRLLNSARGWDAHQTPVDDVGWALRLVRDRHGLLPTALVGHSLGGRAALLAGHAGQVTTISVLNAWLHADEPSSLTGRRVMFVHGSEDRVALPDRALSLAKRLASRNAVSFLTVEGGRHAMLRHRRAFEAPVARFTAESLLGQAGG